MDTKVLEKLIIVANEAYRKGEAIMSDKEYDLLVDELKKQDPENPLINKIGLSPESSDSRKEKLPIFMGSLNKVKTLDEIKNWLEGKGILSQAILIATPKYDGMSLLKDEEWNKAWTRGDGEIGLNVTQHLSFVRKGNYTSNNGVKYSCGEAIISKKIFAKKYAKEYANPRNMVASLFNTISPDINKLADVTYIRYGAIFISAFINEQNKKLDYLNRFLNTEQVPYKCGHFKDFGKEVLDSLYHEWNNEFEIDGIVLEVLSPITDEILGRETNGNPAGLRAYKGDFEEVKETVVKNIRYQISKYGALKPVMEIETINLEGAEVTNVTAYNAKYLIEKGIDIGSKVTVKRSGKVIPKIVNVLDPTENVNLPLVCPCCGSVVQWDENRVDLYCSNENCPDRIIMVNLAFFEGLGVEIGEPSIRKAYNAGYTSIPVICKMLMKDWIMLEGFGYESSGQMREQILLKLKKATLKELMAASPYFPGLGLKTLNTIDFCIDINYLEDDDVYYNQMRHKLMNIEGISFVSAQSYLSGLPGFYAFLRELPVEFRVWDQEKKGDLFQNMIIVFTGFRDAELEKIIVKGGGKVSTSVSSSTTLVVTDDFNSTTAKMAKARELNIAILTLEAFKNHYKL